MILLVDESLFSTHVSRVDLITMLRLSERRQATIVFQTHPKPNSRTVSSARRQWPEVVESWRREFDPQTRQELLRVLQKACLPSIHAAIGNPRRLLVSETWRSKPGCCVVSLDQAVRVLAEPLHILLENGLRDAAFLRAVMPPDWRSKLVEWEKSGRTRFEQGGGITEIRSLIDAVSEGHAETVWGLPKAAWCALHFAIFDRDTDAKTGHPSKIAAELEKKCAEQGLGRHMLRRRKQESYLPVEAMKLLVNEKITDANVRTETLRAIDEWCQGDRERSTLRQTGVGPDFWKGRFWSERSETYWKLQDVWFERDGSRPEMTLLAEAIRDSM